jgi:hypothetical protein
MSGWGVVAGVCLLATGVAAQGPVRVDPVVTEAPAPAIGWVVVERAGGAPEPQVTAHGPIVRIVTAARATVQRPDVVLRGAYTVSLRFQVAMRMPETAYGLQVGPTPASSLRCVVRGDGQASVHVGDEEASAGLVAQPVTLREEMTIALRVSPQGVTCLVDGTDVGRVPVPWPAASDSWPGVWVGAGTDVRVSGLSILGVPPTPREPR